MIASVSRFSAAFFLAVLLSMGRADIAQAASCEEKARELASSSGAKVLAVSTDGDKCVIRLLVQDGNKPPRRKTVVVAK